MKDYFKNFEKFINPIGYRDGMVINSPFSHLGSKKKLMMVGHNPGGVSQESNTNIKEDWNRHMADPSFNALNEDWDGEEGTHPIQLLNTTLIENTGFDSVEEFRKIVLKETGVSFCGRHHFGRPLENEKDYYIRLAFSGIGVNDLKEGMKLFKRWIASNSK